MQEIILMKRRDQTSPVPPGIYIQNSVPEASWVGKGVTKLPTEEWEFDSVENPPYIRIPSAGTPNPLSDDCRIVFEATIHNQLGTALIMLGKWLQVAKNGEMAFVRDSNGRLLLSIGSIYENQNIITDAFIELGERFTIEYTYIDSIVRVRLNDVLAFTSDVLVNRAPGVDWVIGSYLNSKAAIIAYPTVAKADWTLHALNITKI